MSTGLDAAAGIAGLISLSVTVFNGCIKGIQLIAAAKYMREDAGRIRSMLDWESFRLLQWGSRVGLDGPNQSIALNWTVAADILRQLESLITDMKRLGANYNLVTDDDSTEAASSNSTGVGGRTSSIWGLAKPEIRAIKTRIVQETSSSIKKLKWVTLDHDKIRKLQEHICFFIDCLYDLLENQEKKLMSATLSFLLRDLISRTPGSEDLEALRPMLMSNHLLEQPAIHAAVDFKRLRLLLKVDQAPSEKSSMRSLPKTKSPLLKVNKISSSRLVLQQPGELGRTSRQVGVYMSSQKSIHSSVLLEWRIVPKNLAAQLQHRVFELSLLLGNFSEPSFNCLPCLGVSEKETEGPNTMYAFVLEIADLRIQAAAIEDHPKVESLASLLKQRAWPSLSYRFEIALVLAKSILQFHTIGWLHKGIRSDNVLFIGSEGRPWKPRETRGPFIAGFEYARAENPLEMTEDTPSSPEIDLYRHIETLGGSRPPYKKQYDLFSFGCVLIEIGLWKHLADILSAMKNHIEPSYIERLSLSASSNEKEHIRWKIIQKGKDQLSNKDTSTAILDQVAFAAGDNYRAAVKLCLFPELDPDIEDEEPEASLYSQEKIMQYLSEPF